MRTLARTLVLAATLAVPAGASAATIGAQVDPAVTQASCDAVRADTVAAAVVSASIPRLQNGFAGVDRDISGDLACGVEPLLRIPNSLADDPSAYPTDPAAYQAILTSFAAHEKGRVKRYAIENEVNAPGHWSDTAANYFATLRLAHGAIHAGDPDAIVLDSTYASGGITLVRANQLYQAGDLQGAFELVVETQQNELGGGADLTDPSQVGPYLATAKSQKVLSFYPQMLASQDTFDALQLHYYGPSQRLPEIIGMLRDDGMTKPIETWELNRRYLDNRPFAEDGFASEVARLLATDIGESSRMAVISRYIDYAPNAAYGLLSTSGADHASRFAFRTATRMLTPATAGAPLALPGGARGYSFERPQGRVDAFWSDTGDVPVGGALRFSASTLGVTATQGTRPKVMKTAAVRASAAPQYAEAVLPLLERRRGAPGKVKIHVTCPATLAAKRCAGTLTVKGKQGRRGVVRGAREYSLAPGRERDFVVRLVRSAKTSIIIAAPKPCPGGVKPCRSWLRSLR